ncbi:hypothetical protein REPUB_Repub05bG0138500 [Reevesia pubescens]
MVNKIWSIGIFFEKDKRCSFWVFTKLKKKSKLRIDRTAGSGTWLGRSVKEVKDESGLSDYVICEIKNQNAVGPDDDQDQDNSTVELETMNKKRKAAEEKSSVDQTVKKTCVGESYNLNQGNADGWNASTVTYNQQIFEGLEIQDPNKLP